MRNNFWLVLSGIFVVCGAIALMIDMFTKKSTSQDLPIEGLTFSNDEIDLMTEDQLKEIVRSTIFVKTK